MGGGKISGWEISNFGFRILDLRKAEVEKRKIGKDAGPIETTDNGEDWDKMGS